MKLPKERLERIVIITRDQLRLFFIDLKNLLHINLGYWCERNMISKVEFSYFINNRKSRITDDELDRMRLDLIDNIEKTLDYLKNFA